MSVPSKVALKPRLLQLKCHFTWQLLEKDRNSDELKERLDYQLIYLNTKNKYMVYNLLAYIMHLKDDYTEAINNLKKAEESIEGSNSDGTGKKLLVTFGNYAWIYYHMKEYENAQKYIEKVNHIYDELKQLPNGTDKIAEIYGEQGWTLLKFCIKYYEKAKECFEKALELDPEDPEWSCGHATAVYRLEVLGVKKSEASGSKTLQLLQHAVEINPKDAVLKTLLALQLQELKRDEEGRAYIEQARQQAPDLPYVLRYVAKFYRKAGRIDEALSVLQVALDLMPTSGFHHHQIGLCYRQKMINLKKLEKTNPELRYKHRHEMDEVVNKAISHFEKVLQYKKTFVYAYTDLANMYCEVKDYQKAEDTFIQVLQFPNLTDEEKQQINQNYAQFQEYHMKCKSKAIKHYKECFQISFPSRQRDFSEKALKRLGERMIKTYPPQASGFELLGFVYKNKDNIKDAIECYEEALKHDPGNAEYLSELCDLKLKI
ncbi:PREDICTED: interferon-induced protein with tetratricopeptide repeats 5-like [Nanorana parkeri]|uniref:interferon-induced protein with tetratricopeptide repeats 5-like n=1 Tax=Nanorana parkeri TaxID=125878 RepID=UPI00085402BE|nr:PREDICTED: interferon-induced protein with tetratricopeptide repeats 5-like [Nanorana parkeri]